MRFIAFLALLCLLFATLEAKKKENKESYWEHAFNEVYEHASDASEHIQKGASKAYAQVNKVIDTDQIASAASSAYQKAAAVVTSPEVSSAASAVYDTAASLGQQAVDASSAAYVTVNEAIESGEASRVASEAMASAAAAASQLGQQAAQVSSSAYATINRAVESGDLKAQASTMATEAVEGARSLAGRIGQGLSELAKGRQVDESWTAFATRVAPGLVYESTKEQTGEPTLDTVLGDESRPEATEETVAEKEKKWADIVLFWRAFNGTSVRESLAHFAERFYYGKDEDEKRAANNGWAAAVSAIAGTFRQLNAYGEPIYARLSGAGWGMRQINAVGERAIYKPSLFGSALSGFGSVFWYGSLAAETVNVANAAAKDLDEGTSSNTVRASSKAVASWTAAAVGASAGASLCSFVPVVGTVAGGLAGGIAGAYAGEMAGEAAAKAYEDAFGKQQS